MPWCYCVRCSCHRCQPQLAQPAPNRLEAIDPISSFCPASISRHTSASACRYTRLSRPVAWRCAAASAQNSRPAAPTSAGHSPSPDTFSALSFRLARCVAALPAFGPLFTASAPITPESSFIRRTRSVSVLTVVPGDRPSPRPLTASTVPPLTSSGGAPDTIRARCISGPFRPVIAVTHVVQFDGSSPVRAKASRRHIAHRPAVR